MKLILCLISVCLFVNVIDTRDDRTLAESINDMLKETPVAPVPKCVAKLKNVFGHGHRAPSEALGGFIGRGYDFFRDKIKFTIFDDSYDNCNVSSDNKYIIPNFYKLQILTDGKSDKRTNIFTTFESYQDSSSSNTDMDGGGGISQFSLKGSYSQKTTEVKTNINKNNKTLIITHMTYKKYHVDADDSASVFNRRFEQRLEAVIKAQRNQLSRLAHYLVEDIYSDYGTDVVNGATLGMKLEQIVYISSSVTTSSIETTNKIKTEVNAGFQKMFNAKFNSDKENNSTSISEISQIDRTEYIHAIGIGYTDFVTSNFKNVESNSMIAVLFRTTIPIYKMINIGTIRTFNVTDAEINLLKTLFQNVYNEIMELNKHIGCTDKNYYNFNYQAIERDSSCDNQRCEYTPINVNELRHKCNTACGSNFQENGYYVNNDCDCNLYRCIDTLVGGNKNDGKTSSKTLQKNENKLDTAFECSKKHNLVTRDEKLQTENCNTKEPSFWSEKVENSGFFQECIETKLSLSFDNNLLSIGKEKISPCEKLTSSFPSNIKTCPSGTKKTEIIEYEHQLRDYRHDYECDGTKISMAIKYTVTLKLFWCKGPRHGLYYGGSFQRGQINSFNRKEGCSDDMTEVKILHDTIICLRTIMRNGVPENQVPLLKMITSKTSKFKCNTKESKELLGNVNNMFVYGCILRKSAYNNASSAPLLQLPFNDYFDMFETHSESVMIVNKTQVIKLTKPNQLLETHLKLCSVKKTTTTLKPSTLSTSLELENTTVKILIRKPKKDVIVFNQWIIPVSIVGTILIIAITLVIICLIKKC